MLHFSPAPRGLPNVSAQTYVAGGVHRPRPRARRHGWGGAFLLVIGALLGVASASALPGSGGTLDLIPGDALATITLRDGATRAEEIRDSDAVKRLLESEPFEALRNEPNFLKAQGVVYLLAGSAGLDPWKLLAQALGREATFALLPGKGGAQPTALLVIEPQDAAIAQRLLTGVLQFVGAASGGKASDDRTREIDGVRIHQIGPGLTVATIGERIAFCNDAERLGSLGRSGSRPRLADAPRFVAASKAVPGAALAWSFVDLQAIRAASPPVGDGKLDNPLAGVLFGALVQSALKADAGAAWLSVEPDGALALRGRLIGGAPSEATLKAFCPPADGADWSRLELPGLMTRVYVSREWNELWDAREKFLDEQGVRGLAEFAGTLTTIMGNFDFSSELLPEMRPALQLLISRQRFDATAPTPELPGFALLVHLKNAQKVGPRLESAMLALLGFLNIDAGQKMQPQYQLGIDVHRNVRVVSARFPQMLDAGPPGIRHNFEPCFAAVQDRFVIATSRRMLCDVIEAAEKLPTATAAAGKRCADLIDVDVPEVLKILAANRELLVTNRMLSEDLPRETVAAQMGLVFEAIKQFERLRIEMEPVQGGLELAVRVKPVRK